MARYSNAASLSPSQLAQLELAGSLDGQHIAYATTGSDGKPVLRWAILRNLGPEHLPKCMEVRYDDGKVDREEPRRLQRNAVPARPSANAAIAMLAGPAAAAAATVPDRWNLWDPHALHHAMHTLMPGDWSAGHITRLAKYMPGGSSFLREDGRPELARTHPAEVAALLRVVDLSWCGSVLDPWSGTNTIKAVLNASGHVVYTNDICPWYEADTHHDALQPAFYRQARARGQASAIVCSPWFKVLDLAAALSVKYATQVVCLHAPGHFVTDAPPPRRLWLRNLQEQGRLVFITGLPNASMGWKCIWVLVFASREVKERMMRPGRRALEFLV